MAVETLREAPPAPEPPVPGPLALFLAFGKIGITAFGGGLSGWVMQDMVRKRRWVSEDDFLAGLAMSQALPGVNVVNLAIWIGYRMGGGLSALCSALGIVVPPMIMVSLFALVYEWLARFPGSARAIEGAVAASIGFMIAMGVRVGQRSLHRVATATVMIVVFVGVAFLKLPIVLVVAVLAPISVALAYRREVADAR